MYLMIHFRHYQWLDDENKCENQSLLHCYKNIKYTIFFFKFLIGIHSMQGCTATTRHGVKRKRNTKTLRHTRNLFRKNLQLKDVC